MVALVTLGILVSLHFVLRKCLLVAERKQAREIESRNERAQNIQSLMTALGAVVRTPQNRQRG